VIDLHAHVLPGVDDGPKTIDESLAVLRDAAAGGTNAIVATPHVRSDYPTDPQTMERLVAELREAAHEAGIAIELLPGGELDIPFLHGLDDASLARFGLGGNPRLLLVEFPYRGWPLDLPETLFQLRMRGFRSVLAHPERNADVQEAPERLRPLVEAGALVQLTAGSLDGRLGRRSERCARTLLDAELAHVVASDAHGPTVRQVGLRDALDALGDEALGRWLVADVPAALLDGASLPPRPHRRSRARLRLRH
jgi:protein-tyrosine phosphatase